MNNAEIEYRLEHLTQEQKAEMARMFQNGTIRTCLDYFEYLDNQARVEESLQVDKQKIEIEEQINEKLERLQGKIEEKIENEQARVQVVNENLQGIAKDLTGLIARMVNEKLAHAKIDLYLGEDGGIYWKLSIADD